MTAYDVLDKKGWRSDRFWANRFIYTSDILKRVPFTADVRALSESQYWSREMLDRYAWQRTREIVRASARLPFWRDTFAAVGLDPEHLTPESFARLPIVTRAEFSHDDVTRWTDPALLPHSLKDHTSGSTGQPFEFFVDAGFELRSFAICERMIQAATGGERLPIVSLRARHKLGFAFFDSHLFYIRNYNTIRYRLPELVEFIRKRKSEIVLYGFASAFVELALRANEAGISLPIRAAISTGEGLRATDRAIIEDYLDTQYYMNYATRELGWLGFECEKRALHLNEEWALIEILDDDGNAVPDGVEGRVVTTVFENRVMPLIRYANGDRGVISPDLCECGRSLRTLRVMGRQVDRVQFDDGRVVSTTDLAYVFDLASRTVDQFQIVQTDMFAFSVKIVPGPYFEVNRGALEASLIQALHPSARITWDVVKEIPAAGSGKAVYFIPLARQ